MAQKPNILFILVDEMRFPPVYETKEIQKWRKENLPAQNFLRDNGLEFLNHYTGATACSPSRATIFTGQYPSLHGVSQTDGAAKTAFDPDMFWLDSSTVPTLGDYLEAGNYRTYYKGKWHISDADIHIPGSHDPLLSYHPETGVPDPRNQSIYLSGNRLSKFGFSDWIGPEPHGSSSRDSGSSASLGLSGRDVVYSAQVSNLLNRLNRSESSDPWFITASFVNPHDIALFGEVSRKLPSFNFEPDESVPEIPPSPTANENLSGKPSAQASYKAVYQKAFQPTIDSEQLRRLYYSLQKQVDSEIQTVLTALSKTKFADNTLVIFTSDHGDMLGAHGMFQKWYNAYEESLHVPLIIYGPKIPKGKRDFLTSHVDLVPTILALAGLNPSAPLIGMKSRYSNLVPFVGKDLTPIIYGCPISDCKCVAEKCPETAIYFMTDDNVTKGLDQLTIFGVPYKPVTQPNSVETVITRIRGKIYKYSRYFDPEDDKVPSEYEMYNLSEDPTEVKNLVNYPENAKLGKILQGILLEQSQTKRIYPSQVRHPIARDPRPS